MRRQQRPVGQLVGYSDARLAAHGPANRAPRIESHRRPDRPARPISLPPMVGASPDEIRLLLRLLVVFFLCDDSGSMYGSWGDPTGVRYAAAQSLLGLIERGSGRGASSRAAVIHWGTDAPAELALAPVDVKRGRKALRGALTVPPTLMANNLPLALARAHEMTPTLIGEEQAIYFVLSDGIEDVTPAMHAAIGALPAGSVHMVLVDRSGGCDPAREAAWNSVAFGSFTRLKTFDTGEMARQLAEVFAASIGLQMPAASTSERN
jgi:hypothetical protein